jgi:S-adenosylmethionine:tRNA ribosyltransferase-isomerase
MRLSELDYKLPEELIARHPCDPRDQARMLVLDRGSGQIEHSRFYKLQRFLREGDLLVLNNTRVLPARLFAHKETGGDVELLIIRPAENNVEGAWIALARSRRPLREGARLILENGRTLLVTGHYRSGRPLISSAEGIPIQQILIEAGVLALPHYIDRPVTAADSGDYQTIYAVPPGAVAAPTAGLHFTEALFAELDRAGIRRAFLTLHIGPGTFAPVRAAEIEAHTMEAEWYVIPPETLSAIDLARRLGGRIIAVGTSTTRALESYARTNDSDGFTGLFISPGFRFKLVESMITNFHMPRSTVLAMVMALADRELILEAYTEAIRHRYRFLSYGDAMLIL